MFLKNQNSVWVPVYVGCHSAKIKSAVETTGMLRAHHAQSITDPYILPRWAFLWYKSLNNRIVAEMRVHLRWLLICLQTWSTFDQETWNESSGCCWQIDSCKK